MSAFFGLPHFQSLEFADKHVKHYRALIDFKKINTFHFDTEQVNAYGGLDLTHISPAVFTRFTWSKTASPDEEYVELPHRVCIMRPIRYFSSDDGLAFATKVLKVAFHVSDLFFYEFASLQTVKASDVKKEKFYAERRGEGDIYYLLFATMALNGNILHNRLHLEYVNGVLKVIKDKNLFYFTKTIEKAFQISWPAAVNMVEYKCALLVNRIIEVYKTEMTRPLIYTHKAANGIQLLGVPPAGAGWVKEKHLSSDLNLMYPNNPLFERCLVDPDMEGNSGN